VSIIAVAQRAGVSIATVSRAFNSPDRVTPATRQAVAAAADALGYVPNLSARTLRTSRSRTLGVLLPTLHNPVFAECLAGIAMAAAEAGFSILPATTDYDEQREQHGARALIARAVDGVILTVANAAGRRRSITCGAPACPTCWPTTGMPTTPASRSTAASQCASWSSGWCATATAASRCSAARSRPPTGRGSASRAMRGDAAIDAAPELIEVPFLTSAADALADACALRSARPRSSARTTAGGALPARRRAGRAVGAGDLSVVGFDGIGIGADLSPSLASIAQPNAGIGHECVRWLVGAIERGGFPSAADSMTLAHQLRALESLGPVPSLS
jgi:DNA-binding LacI/PurR family transcriptional regulator